MVSEERVYLDVPFLENDQVKALGARWDGQRRQWWVDPRRVPLEQVARWREEAALSPAPRAGEATVPLRLLGLRQTCWSCRRPTTALVGLLPVATSDIDDMLICQDEATLRLAATLLPEHARTASQVGRIRPRSSNTEQATYLSNGCFHCEVSLARVMGPPFRQWHGTTCRGLQRRRRDDRRGGGCGSRRWSAGWAMVGFWRWR
jgi:Domain of unknown function (DUF5710)